MKRTLSILACLISTALFAQIPGTDFWFAVPPNNPEEASPTETNLTIGAEDGAEVLLQAPGVDWEQTLTLAAGEVASLILPVDMFDLTVLEEGISEKAIHVSSTAPITLNLSSQKEHSAGSTPVLPSDQLSAEYTIERPIGTGQVGFALIVVAQEENTTGNLTLEGELTLNIPFSLDPGEVWYHEIPGSEWFAHEKWNVAADSPVAVFRVNLCSAYLGDCGYCDMSIVQAKPAAMGAFHFLLNPLRNTNGYDTQYGYSVLALENDTDVSTPEGMVTMNAGQSLVEMAEGDPIEITADKPILVKKIHLGTTCSQAGDPELYFVPCVNQQMSTAVFELSSDLMYETNYLHIIAPAGSVDGLTLNGAVLDASLFMPTANESYVFADVEVPEGSYTLESEEGFQAWYYGYDAFQSMQSFPHIVQWIQEAGCTDPLACNYVPSAAADDGSCIFSDPGYDCEGECLIDADNDGICDDESYIDFNSDGEISLADLLLMLNYFGCLEAPCQGDLNGDGITNVEDLVLFIQLF